MTNMSEVKMNRLVDGKWRNCADVDDLAEAVLAKLHETGKSFDMMEMASSLACDGNFLRDLPLDEAIDLLASRGLVARGQSRQGFALLY